MDYLLRQLLLLDDHTPRREVDAAITDFLTCHAQGDRATSAGLGDLRDRPREAHGVAALLARGLQSQDKVVRRGAVQALGPDGLSASYLRRDLLGALARREGQGGCHAATARLLYLLGETSEQFVIFLARFLEEHLWTGSARKAFRRAAAALLLARERGSTELGQPSTLGKSSLRGADCLGCNPYDYRGLIHTAMQGLARAAKDHPVAVTWLFEALKLWGSGERDVALDLLLSLDLQVATVASGVAEVVRFSSVSRHRDAAKLFRTLVEAGARDARWLVALLDALDAHPTGAERLPDGVIGYELATPLNGRYPEWVTSLSPSVRSRLLVALDRGSPASRTLAVQVLAADPEEAGPVRIALLRLIREKDLHPRLLEMAALTLLATGATDKQVRDVAERALACSRGRRRKVDEVLAAIIENCDRRLASRETQVVARDGGRLLVALPFRVSGPQVIVGDALYVAYQRIHRAVPASAWMTNEEEAGVVRIRPCGEVTLLPLPVVLPARSTGGAGARREIGIQACIGEKLFLVLTTPFSDQGGWGNQNRIFSFHANDSSWEHWSGEVRGPLQHEPLDSASPRPEADLPSLSYGELIAWTDEEGALRLAVDGTPYHLDDWNRSPAVEQAFSDRALSRKRHGRVSIRAVARELVDHEDWNLSVGEETMHVPGVRSWLRRAWPADGARDRFVLVGGAVLPTDSRDRLLLLMRRFVPRTPGGSVDVLLVLPCPDAT